MKSVKNRNKIILRNPSSIRPWQHVLEPIFGYLMLGGGEHKRMTKNHLAASSIIAQTLAKSDFDVFD